MEFLASLHLYGLGTHFLLRVVDRAIEVGPSGFAALGVSRLAEHYMAGQNGKAAPATDAHQAYAAGQRDAAHHARLLRACPEVKPAPLMGASALWQSLDLAKVYGGDDVEGCCRTAFLQCLSGEVLPTPLVLGERYSLFYCPATDCPNVANPLALRTWIAGYLARSVSARVSNGHVRDTRVAVRHMSLTIRCLTAKEIEPASLRWTPELYHDFTDMNGLNATALAMMGRIEALATWASRTLHETQHAAEAIADLLSTISYFLAGLWLEPYKEPAGTRCGPASQP
jgi:hypothetical protein